MEISTLIEILTALEKCQQTKGSGTVSLEDFRLFLNGEAYRRENPRNLSDKFDLNVYDLENEIAKQVIMLSRYSKHLLKKALEPHPDLVNEDFTYLFRLMDYESLTKMQLIEKNAHEKQTGIEIIKRLVKNGLLQEKPDAEDRRSTRISVTQKGKEVFAGCMKDITMVSRLMCGQLNTEKKRDLLKTLTELNTFHQTLYVMRRQEKPAELLKILQ